MSLSSGIYPSILFLADSLLSPGLSSNSQSGEDGKLGLGPMKTQIETILKIEPSRAPGKTPLKEYTRKSSSC
eukprot:scaffold3199_cov113-Skeletonema_dohrnii-CCMP3373.AAC.6